MFRVALACEGPTDRVILEAVLDFYLDDYVAVPVQPPIANLGGPSGPFGGGWKGVRTWCQQEGAAPGGLESLLANVDVFILQVDADVSREKEIGRAKPCPPPGDGADEIRALLQGWLGRVALPDRVVPLRAVDGLRDLGPRGLVPVGFIGSAVRSRTIQ